MISKDLEKNIEFLELAGHTVIIVVVNSYPQLIIGLEEKHLTKNESKEVIDYIKYNLKMKTAMITGDNRHSAMKVADYLGIETVIAEAYPNDKQEAVY